MWIGATGKGHVRGWDGNGLGIGFGYHLLPHVRHNMNELGWRGHDMSGVVLTKVYSSKNKKQEE
jgi:hypothetical protein